nr:alpha/beta hydrolase-fold protein [Actinomycetota bacterium]
MLPLTSVRLLVVLAVLVVAAIGVAIMARRLTTAYPTLLRIASGVLAVVFLVAGIGAAVNRHYGLYRTWPDLLGTHSADLVSVHGRGGLQAALAPLAANAPVPTHGTLFEINIPGVRSGVEPRSAFVYLPPQYRDPLYATATFPVVEAFQGSPGRPSDWVRGLHVDHIVDAAIARGLVAPSIVVMPDTNGGLARSLECADTADGKNDEQFLVTDVRSWVEQNLRARPGRWAGLGYSTGGYCALDLALRHPDQFYAAVSLDGYAHALQDHYARGIWRSVTDRLAHSPDWWVANYPPELVDIYLLAGLSDPSSVREAVRFWDELGHYGWRGRHNRLVVQKGGRHTFPAWEAALGPAMEWAVPGPAAKEQRQSPVDGQALLAALPTASPSATRSSAPC